MPAEVVPCLERLRASGLKLVVVSNANGTVSSMFDRLGILRFFHHVFDSQIEGVEKPDPRFFRIALRGLGLAARDDPARGRPLPRGRDGGARSAGIRAALLDPAGLYDGADCPRYASLTELAEDVVATPGPRRARAPSPGGDMHLTRLAVSPAIALSSGVALASQRPDDVPARLATLVPRLMEEAVVPGVQIALIRNGTTAWHGAFGLANTQTGARSRRPPCSRPPR